MKKIILIISLITLTTWARSQETYLNCDFSKGIPDTFTLYDADGNSPSVDMERLGFRTGVSWLAYYIETERNRVACSTSWYSPAGTSDDWMITHSFKIKSDKAILSWTAKASDKNYKDGYSVYISETGKSINDFDRSNPLFKIEQEEALWTKYRVSLEDYKDKEVYIAFVNDSYNKSCLYIDDIYAGVPSSVYLMVDLPEIIDYAGDVTISGEAYTELDTPIEGFTIGLEHDGQLYTKTYDDVTLLPGERFAFELDEKIHINPNQTLDYSLWIENGEDRYALDNQLTAYVRKVVVEESTGTWCGWCIRGIVNMERMEENYPDSYIGIAVHSGDVMADSYYNSSLNQISSGDYPRMIVNRKKSLKGDPALMETYYKSAFAEGLLVGMDLNCNFNKETRELTANTQLLFADNYEGAGFKLSYVLKENNIHQPGDNRYNQKNSYAGGASGPMGGYENLPEIISSYDMYFQDVARYVEGDFKGIEESVPADITAHEAIHHSVTFNLSDNIFNDEETDLIALLLNDNGEIVNAEKVSLKLNDTSIQNVSEKPVIEYRKENNYLFVKTTQEIKKIKLISADGKMININPSINQNEAIIPVLNLSGFNILQIQFTKEFYNYKVIL